MFFVSIHCGRLQLMCEGDSDVEHFERGNGSTLLTCNSWTLWVDQLVTEQLGQP